MSGKKKFPQLSKNLSSAISELGEAFDINSFRSRKLRFVKSIRENNNVLVMLDICEKGRVLIWTKERGKRKLILLSPEAGLEDRDRFKRWVEMPAASMLRRRRIHLEFTSRGEAIEFKWGADDDVTVIEHKKR